MRTPLDRQAWGDSTLKGDTLYLHVFHWPASGHLVVGGLQSDVAAAYLLSDPEKKELKARRISADDVSIDLPRSTPDSADTVVVLKSRGPVKAITGRLLQASVAENVLLGFDAEALGTGFSYGDGKTARYYVDGLEKPGNALKWNVRVDEPSRFKVAIRYRTPESKTHHETRFVVRLGERVLNAPVTGSSGEHGITTLQVGELEMKPGELQPLSVSLDSEEGAIHFFEIDLTPVRKGK